MNNIFVMYSCCSIFTKQLIFSSSNFVINESNNPDRKNTEKWHYYSYFGINIIVSFPHPAGTGQFPLPLFS